MTEDEPTVRATSTSEVGLARSSLASRRPLGLVGRLRRRVKNAARLRRLYWLRAKLRLAPSDGQRLLILTAVIGASCGLAAVAFHLFIRLVEMGLIERAMDPSRQSWIAWTILTPTLGGLVCGIVLQYSVPRARGSGIPEVKAVYAGRGQNLRIRDSVGKFGLSALQIGSGASLGREGPTVHICSGIASLIGRLAHLSPRHVRRLLPVGAAAGVAAAFNAPISAVTFTIEEIVGDLDKTVLSGVVVAAAIAAIVERSVLGEHPVFSLAQQHGLDHVSSLIVYVLLGVVAALVSVLFTDSLLRLRQRMAALKLLPGWVKPAIGGLVTGSLAVLALSWLGQRGVTGGGYSTLEFALNGHMLTKAMLVLCALKLVATTFSYSSGGAGGIFAPSLFVGGMLGGGIGALDTYLLGHGEGVGSFVLVGMGAVFAATIRAPITSVLIIIEMTGGYSLILPLMIANMIAYGLARHLRPTPIYDALLEQDGVHLRATAGMHVLEGVRIHDVLNPAQPVTTFNERVLAHELLSVRGTQEVYPVLERESGRLVGIITDEELDLLAGERGLDHLVNAADVMRPPFSMRRDDDLRAALESMLVQKLRKLPVTDEAQRFLGMVDEATVARAYLRGHTT